MLSDTLPMVAATLPWSRTLIALWLILSSMQWLAAARLFAPDGLLPWHQLARIRGARWLMGARRRMSVPALQTLLWVQLGVAIVLLGGVTGPAMIMCLGTGLLIQATMITLSGAFWVDGSDKIGMIALAGTLLTALGVRSADPALAWSGILLTGGQLILCYLVAGLSKLRDRRWRSGAALAAAMATRAWGHAGLSALLRRRSLALAANWGVILLEALFPLALLLPLPGLLVALGLMLAFHFATALFMGLNTFPWAFAAAYPSVVALGQIVGRGNGWSQ